MKWSFDNNMPIYSQIIEQIKLFISSGDIGAGERLPSVRELATDAGVNPNTMQRALSELEGTGLIFSDKTRGRFVTEDAELIARARKELAQKSISGFLNFMHSLGCTKEEIFSLIKDCEGDDDNE